MSLRERCWHMVAFWVGPHRLYLLSDPEIWSEPSRFRPERFEVEPRPGTWLPFMLGARRCAGEDFAMMELITTVAAIVSRFRLELTDLAPRRPAGKVQLSPDRPIVVRVVAE